MKRALIVANLAGFSSFLLHDMEILSEKGYQVDFAANGERLPWNDMEVKLKAMGVHFEQVCFDSQNMFSRDNLRAYRQLRKLLKEKKYDLIHCHTPIAGLLVRIAAIGQRAKGCCVVYTTHGFAFNTNNSRKKNIFFATIEAIGALLSDAVITINREDYENALRLPCKQTYYIHGVGVNTAIYRDVEIDRDAYRHSIGVGPEDIMVLSVGELSQRKNHQIIIKALSKLSDKERYVYVICGNGINGGTGTELQELAKKNGVRLNLLGFRSDIPQITACSDVGAIPSVREGLGLSGIQSLAAGIPLIGTDVQGIRDYIENGKTGILCGAFDDEAYAQGLEKLVKMNSKQRELIRENCYRMAKQFDFSVSFAEMEAIYNELLEKG